MGKSQFNDPYFNGSIDDFRVYARALSAGELTAFANPVAEAPDTLTAIPDNGKASLSWPLADATSCNVKRAGASGGPYTTIAAGLAASTYDDTSVNNGTTYYYVVTGGNTRGESATTAPPKPSRRPRPCGFI